MKPGDWPARRAGLKSTPGSPAEGSPTRDRPIGRPAWHHPLVTYPGNITSRAGFRATERVSFVGFRPGEWRVFVEAKSRNRFRKQFPLLPEKGYLATYAALNLE